MIREGVTGEQDGGILSSVEEAAGVQDSWHPKVNLPTLGSSSNARVKRYTSLPCRVESASGIKRLDLISSQLCNLLAV